MIAYGRIDPAALFALAGGALFFWLVWLWHFRAAPKILDGMVLDPRYRVSWDQLEGEVDIDGCRHVVLDCDAGFGEVRELQGERPLREACVTT